jgi:hypothetical protein
MVHILVRCNIQVMHHQCSVPFLLSPQRNGDKTKCLALASQWHYHWATSQCLFYQRPGITAQAEFELRILLLLPPKIQACTTTFGYKQHSCQKIFNLNPLRLQTRTNFQFIGYTGWEKQVRQDYKETIRGWNVAKW